MEFCPRCNRMVVTRQQNKKYRFISELPDTEPLLQMICNVCGVTVSVDSDRQDIQEDLKTVHKMIREIEKPRSFVEK